MDIELSAAVVYIRMNQFSQAQESLSLILDKESEQTEATLLLCWTLTSNLIALSTK